MSKHLAHIGVLPKRTIVKQSRPAEAYTKAPETGPLRLRATT